MSIPDNLLYTSHDEWVRHEDGVVVVGITHFAQDALGEIVHVELPSMGASFAAGAVIGEIESVKAVAEIYAPVSGEVVAINDTLEDEPEAINQEPYQAWLFKLKVSDSSELSTLLTHDAYQAKVEA